jgi:drug/metabolite transporter (DMT)-like permease
MSVTVQIGLLLALATALASMVGFLYKHRGAVESPPVEWRRPLHSSVALLRSHWYLLGMAIALASWGFHVAALSLAPISLVQSVIAGGLVLLTVCADRLFGFSVTRREWIGVGLTAVGLAFLAATLDGTGRSAHADYAVVVLAPYIATAAMLGVAVAVLAHTSFHRGALLGVSAGLLWGASDVAIKALSGELDQGAVAVLIDPLAAVIALASLAGMLVSARSLQLGDAVPVIAVTSAAANLVTICAGPIVFGEPMPDDSAGVVMRVLAFGLVISAAALTPAPLRAARLRAG